MDRRPVPDRSLTMDLDIAITDHPILTGLHTSLNTPLPQLWTLLNHHADKPAQRHRHTPTHQTWTNATGYKVNQSAPPADRLCPLGHPFFCPFFF